MTRRWAKFFCTASALGLASCADAPKQATTVTRTAPLVTQQQEISPEEPAAPSMTQGKVTRIPLGTFFQLQQSDKALIFDVRPGFYYGLGHVPGAINWPRGRFESQLSQREAQIQTAIAAGKPVLLYCTDLACPDALNVASRLAERGHSSAILQGGWEAWKAGELPIE
jgi:rhodanese-related sulfurtransferase